MKKKPKEKAEELINKFTITGGDLIQCCAYATICVDEIITEFKLMVPEPYKQQYKYWEEVCDEIKKISQPNPVEKTAEWYIEMARQTARDPEYSWNQAKKDAITIIDSFHSRGSDDGYWEEVKDVIRKL